jgi:hypothetical protein
MATEHKHRHGDGSPPLGIETPQHSPGDTAASRPSVIQASSGSARAWESPHRVVAVATGVIFSSTADTALTVEDYRPSTLPVFLAKINCRRLGWAQPLAYDRTIPAPVIRHDLAEEGRRLVERMRGIQ